VVLVASPGARAAGLSPVGWPPDKEIFQDIVAIACGDRSVADSATNGRIGFARLAFHANDVVKRVAAGTVESGGTLFSLYMTARYFTSRSKNSGFDLTLTRAAARSLNTIGTARFPLYSGEISK